MGNENAFYVLLHFSKINKEVKRLKKLVLAVITGAVLLSNVAFVSAKTVDKNTSKDSNSNTYSFDSGIKVNSQDPRG